MFRIIFNFVRWTLPGTQTCHSGHFILVSERKFCHHVDAGEKSCSHLYRPNCNNILLTLCSSSELSPHLLKVKFSLIQAKGARGFSALGEYEWSASVYGLLYPTHKIAQYIIDRRLYESHDTYRSGGGEKRATATTRTSIVRHAVSYCTCPSFILKQRAIWSLRCKLYL
jgi:hypothetical protein